MQNNKTSFVITLNDVTDWHQLINRINISDITNENYEIMGNENVSCVVLFDEHQLCGNTQ
jgi:hypothetical protein